jgi:hypothetical protein
MPEKDNPRIRKIAHREKYPAATSSIDATRWFKLSSELTCRIRSRKMSCPCIGSGTADSTVVRSAGTEVLIACAVRVSGCHDGQRTVLPCISQKLELGTCFSIILLWLFQGPMNHILKKMIGVENVPQPREAKLWIRKQIPDACTAEEGARCSRIPTPSCWSPAAAFRETNGAYSVINKRLSLRPLSIG